MGEAGSFFRGNGMSEDTGMLKPVAFSKMNENRQESCLIRLSRSDGKSGNIKYCSRFFLYFLGSSTIACARILPDEIENELRRAGVAKESVGIVVQPVDGQKPILALNADMAFHPASTMKVVTTYAALELLGPHYRWKTNAYVTGKLEEGVLHGDLIIKGSGESVFFPERSLALCA